MPVGTPIISGSSPFGKACRNMTDEDLAEHFVAYIVSGVPEAHPQQFDKDVAKKVLKLIEDEIQKNI